MRAALFALLFSALFGCGAPDALEAAVPAAPAQAQQATAPAPNKSGPRLPRPDDTVQMFDPAKVEWRAVPLREVPPEGEFLFDGALIRLRGKAGLFEWINTVNVSLLPEADRPFTTGPHLRFPDGSDVVRTLGTNARHCPLSEVIPGEQFVYQGRVFETRSGPDNTLEFQDTGKRHSRVLETYKRQTNTLVDLTVYYPEKKQRGVLTGTLEHPFYVPGRGYVPIGELRPGTKLLTDEGGYVAVVEKSSRRHGKFDVYNLKVEGAHNYFVTPPGSADDVPGVLVHNTSSLKPSTLKPGPYAKESIPAHRGRPTAAEQRQVNELMGKHGCHTCGTKNPGTKSGNAVADHQPPQALDEPVEFLPHCNDCKARQGGEVLQEMIRRAKQP